MHVATGVAHTYMHIQVGLHAYTSVLIVTFIFLFYPCIVLSLYCVIFVLCYPCVIFIVPHVLIAYPLC